MNRLVVVFLLSTVALPIATAQNTSDATLQALLAEVKLLRAALEKSAVVVPQIQLTLQRMQLQQEVVTRASRELDQVREQLQKSAGQAADFAAEATALEAEAAKQPDPAARKTMEDRARQMKSMPGGLLQRDSQLRLRENELTGRLRTEQAKLDDLSARLNALDKMLEVQPSR